MGADAVTVVASGSVQKIAAEVSRSFLIDLTTDNPVEALVRASGKHESGRALLVIDEVEKTLEDPQGLAFLDNLRDAYERAAGSFGIVVLGGTGVRDLLLSEASPFLRIAGPIQALTGLERDEAARLMREPLQLDIPDDVVDALWAETAGHPWLLQMFMEIAVQRASSPSDVAGHLAAAMQGAEPRLHSIAFPIWWRNLRAQGQEMYRRVVREPSPVPREQWVARFGNDPRPWLEVLASTGLVSLHADSVIARGTLFRRWMELNHPPASGPIVSRDDELGKWLSAVGVDPFERLVIRALAAWARATVEYPAAAVRDDGSLQPEAFFQMHALVALLQQEHELTAEPEALSMRPQGRSDIKVRSRHDPARRACVELKIFGRKGTEVVKQVIDYSAPWDTFAAVVSVDRARRPLRPAYEGRCFVNASPAGSHDAPADVPQPVFYTDHVREGHGPLRVWHFLLQLRDH